MALRVFQQCRRRSAPWLHSSNVHPLLLHALGRTLPSQGDLTGCRTVMTDLHISEGHNRAVIEEEVKKLVQKEWEVSKGKELRKTFHFKGHQKSIKFGMLTVCWTTHNPQGLSEKDIMMAKYSDEQAECLGAVAADKAIRCG